MTHRAACCLFLLLSVVGFSGAKVATAADGAGARAVTVPATLSGTWTGKAKAATYLNTTTNPTAKDTPKSTNVQFTAVFSQSGTSLTMQATFTVAAKNQPTQTLIGVLNGVYGNGNFWVIGVTSNANQSQTVVLTGHATSKGISGVGIVFNSDNDNEIKYALKPQTTAGQIAADASHVTSLCGNLALALTRASAPVTVSGKAGGKGFSLADTSKALPFVSAVTGTITTGDTTASALLTLSDGTGSETYTLNGPNYGKTFVLFGPNSGATQQAIFSIHAGTNSAKGIGIVYGQTGLIELKLGLKKQ